MSATFEINGKRLLSVKSAAKQTNYSRDYVTRLAREGKVLASQIGRQWFIDLDSLKQYESVAALEQKVRQQQLSEERRREREQVQNVTPAKKASGGMRFRKASSPRVRRVAVSLVALTVLVGGAMKFVPGVFQGRQLASVPLVEQVQQNFSNYGESKTADSKTEPIQFMPGTTAIRDFTNAEKGVLLMPGGLGGSSTVDAKKFFSDDVVIRTDAEGQNFVVQKNERSEVIEEIPFIVVPVNESSI